MKLRRSLTAVTAVAALVLGMTGVAYADDVINNVASTSDGKIVTITKGGPSASVGWKVVEDNNDSTDRSGCNVGGGGNAATMTPTIAGGPADATAPVAPAAQSVTLCNTLVYFAFSAASSTTAGDYTVAVTLTGGKDGSTWDYTDAGFTLRVIEPTVSNPCAGRTAPAAPTITRTTTPDATSGWYNAASPAAKFTVAPATNAEFSADGGDNWTAYSGETTVDGDGTHSVIARNVLPATTDCAVVPGTSSAATTFDIDRTLPGAAPASVVNTTWRNTSLSETFTFSDTGSGLATSQGLTSGAITLTASAESANDSTPTIVSKTVYDVAGNSTTRSVSALIDLTAPVVAPASVTNTIWRNSDLSQAFTALDALSGLADSADASFTLTASTESSSGSSPTVVTKTVTDAAGNSTTRTVSALIDKTGPVVSPADVVNAVWRNTSLSQNFTASDALSDLKVPADASFTLTASAESTKDTDGNVVATVDSKTVEDNAGNTTTRVVSALIDVTDPVISGEDVADNVWRNTSRSADFTASDALSGLDVADDASFTLTASAESTKDSGGTVVPTSVSKTVEDKAGNSATRSLSALIDTTGPVVSVQGLTHGATYTLGSVPTASCSTSDALSGVATAATASTSGGPVGSVTVTCDGAADNAGNTGWASVTFKVVYSWTGFFQPVDNPVIDSNGVLTSGLNKAKAGSAIPVKFNLGGNQGTNIFFDSSYPKVQKVLCPSTTNVTPDAIEETVTANSSGLKYDTTAQQYIYVWKTSSTLAGCYRLDVKLNDGTLHSAYFNFTK